MNKNINKVLAALSVFLLLGSSTPALALSKVNPDKVISKPYCTEDAHLKHDIISYAYKEVFKKIGITKADLVAAQKDGKTIFDLAKAKGYTSDQVRKMLIESETASINAAVNSGKLTKEQGEQLLKAAKDRIAVWDGKFKPSNHTFKGKKFDNLASIKELKITKDDLIKAKDSNKTLFDLEKEKNNMSASEVKDIIIKAKTEHINKKVQSKEISKEDGDKILSNMKSRIRNWDGSLTYNNRVGAE